MMKYVLYAAGATTLMLIGLLSVSTRVALSEKISARFRGFVSLILVLVFYLFLAEAAVTGVYALSTGFWPQAVLIIVALISPFFITGRGSGTGRARTETLAFQIVLFFAAFALVNMALSNRV
jgi:hypothetical protein